MQGIMPILVGLEIFMAFPGHNESQVWVSPVTSQGMQYLRSELLLQLNPQSQSRSLRLQPNLLGGSEGV